MWFNPAEVEVFFIYIHLIKANVPRTFPGKEPGTYMEPTVTYG